MIIIYYLWLGKENVLRQVGGQYTKKYINDWSVMKRDFLTPGGTFITFRLITVRKLNNLFIRFARFTHTIIQVINLWYFL